MATLNIEKIDNEYDLNEFVIQQIQRCIDLNAKDKFLGIKCVVEVFKNAKDFEMKLDLAEMIKNTLDDVEELENA